MSSEAPAVRAIWTHLIEDHVGLHYGANDDILLDRVAARATDLGFESLLDYYYFVRYDPGGAEELSTLVSSLVVGETYFFRELPQLEAAVDLGVLAPLARGERPRVWSAACASGEEPLTVAMLLAARGVLGEVELVASDVSPLALERARANGFSQRSVRDVLPASCRRFLKARQGGGWSVEPSIHAAVRWKHVNLRSPVDTATLGQFHLILLRNVLIYFREDTARRVVVDVARALVPDGILSVGTAESLLRFGTPLVCEEHRGAFVYRKAR